jgi:hypothetical protein
MQLSARAGIALAAAAAIAVAPGIAYASTSALTITYESSAACGPDQAVVLAAGQKASGTMTMGFSVGSVTYARSWPSGTTHSWNTGHRAVDLWSVGHTSALTSAGFTCR